LATYLDLHPNQNRLEHENPYGKRENSIGGSTRNDAFEVGGFVEHTRAQQIGSARLRFVAEVRATELRSGREIWGETANLSKGGCYVSTREPFSQGTLLAIEIRHHGVHFLTDAMVAFNLESNGMGLSFLNVPANELPTLEQWLSSARGERPAGASR
jgi:hypothetical protein